MEPVIDKNKDLEGSNNEDTDEYRSD
jgi:hypothetical protein